MTGHHPDDSAGQIAYLEQEIAVLRRKLADSPRHTRILEERIVELQTNLAGVSAQNERLASTLREARDQIVALKEEVDRLAQPPAGFGVFLTANEDGTADIFTGGHGKVRVNVSPSVELDALRRGQEVMVNEALNVVDAMEYPRVGDIVTLKEILEDGERALVLGHTDEERVVRLAEPLLDVTFRPGDALLLEPRSSYAYEVVPKREEEELVLEEDPDIDYGQIGGLGPQTEKIRRAVEFTQLHPEVCRRMGLRPPRGILLYGPPGCGKTLIAKAVAHSLAHPNEMDPSRSHFLSIKGPALLDKYVGETERRIRFIFRQAREKAHDGRPVIVFFDEMESLFRARGSGISSDVENTIVAQLLAEIDGVEELENVIVIGASNREDMIDPAILRPGRLDLKIRVNRPNREAAMDIFSKHLTPAIPIHPHDLAAHGGDDGEAIRNMIHHAVEFLYAETENNRFVEVTYESLEKEVIYFRDFSSGAAIKNIVDRAKWAAVERHLREMDVPLGVRVQDVIQAAKEEIRDTEQLTNTTNPDDWARISGARGERIVYVRTLGRSARRFSGRALNIQQSNYDL